MNEPAELWCRFAEEMYNQVFNFYLGWLAGFLLSPDQDIAQRYSGFRFFNPVMYGRNISFVFGEMLNDDPVVDQTHQNVGQRVHKPVFSGRRHVFRTSHIIEPALVNAGLFFKVRLNDPQTAGFFTTIERQHL